MSALWSKTDRYGRTLLRALMEADYCPTKLDLYTGVSSRCFSLDATETASLAQLLTQLNSLAICLREGDL